MDLPVVSEDKNSDPCTGSTGIHGSAIMESGPKDPCVRDLGIAWVRVEKGSGIVWCIEISM